jgi:hypothetical protein
MRTRCVSVRFLSPSHSQERAQLWLSPEPLLLHNLHCKSVLLKAGAVINLAALTALVSALVSLRFLHGE